MQAIILAAGRGERMMPLTIDTPKGLLPVNGRPILDYTLENLPERVDEIIFVVGYLGEQIKSRYGDNYQGKKITYVEQAERLGTGHAVSICKDYIHGEKFLALSGDDLFFKNDIEKCLEYELAILVKKISGPIRFGVLKMDENGNLKNIIEAVDEPDYEETNFNIINTSCYTITKAFFNYPLVKLTGRNEYGLPQTLARMVQDYPIKLIEAENWFPIGYPADLVAAENYLKKLKDNAKI